MTKSKRELEAAEYEAKAKSIRRAEKAFWAEVEERLDEVQDRFGLSDKFDKICRTYGAYSNTEKESLYRHLISSAQISYYNRNKPTGDATS